ncbi:EamA family transporter [Bradyrhizobium sp. 83002]|uniref:EamA family transporter n=1 Tax=Bradyrhizobium aeschynomenes TaxID=2734909 RepID=UPI00155674A8|nr:EamA family transporter [Bradyrhizobium aeschynomenes]NPU10128.1 EamA family transporter [Bradyrhizobium aeschynomenes]
MWTSNLAVPAAFAATYLVWGGTYLAVTVALDSIPPFLLMGSRSIAGGGLLLVAAWSANRTFDGRTAARAAACGLLLFVGCHGTLAYAQQRVPSGLAAVLLATIPFWLALIGAVLPGGHRPEWRQFVMLGLGLTGVALIVMGEGKGAAGAIGTMDLGLLLASALSWAVGSVLTERWSPPDREIAFSGHALLSGGLMLVAMSIGFGELGRFDISHVSGIGAGAWLYLTLAGTILAFVSYIWLLKRVPAPLAATYTFVNPVIALLLGWMVLGETFGVAMMIGALLVVVSIGGLLYSRAAAKPAR